MVLRVSVIECGCGVLVLVMEWRCVIVGVGNGVGGVVGFGCW